MHVDDNFLVARDSEAPVELGPECCFDAILIIHDLPIFDKKPVSYGEWMRGCGKATELGA